MRTIDASFVTLVAEDVPPRYVSLATNEVLPMPTTVSARVAYSLDLLTTMRGISWYSDRRWDFTPSSVIALQAPLRKMSRAQFARSMAGWWITWYLIVDVVDTLVKAIPVDPLSQYGISQGLSPSLQLVATVCLCIWTQMALICEFILMAFIFVGVLGVCAPHSWVPMFNAPLASASLAEFWGKRWHHIFRRCFDRMMLPFIPFSPPSKPTASANGNGKSHANGNGSSESTPLRPLPTSTSSTTSALIRATGAFALSTLLHLIIMNRIPPSPKYPDPYQGFWDISILAFFLAQPVGILLDSLFTSTLSPKSQSSIGFSRIWAWAWLLWTSRWWADAWMRKGLWDLGEKPLVWSPLRGMLWGDWTADRVPPLFS
ncbi:hypothetical protein DL93DRAFT_2089556 [Clavulina sp. PMI_390]|nr:hypothetical protein DL93DRAFT_2089556 [Clavulina sp. PMI_390]